MTPTAARRVSEFQPKFHVSNLRVVIRGWFGEVYLGLEVHGVKAMYRNATPVICVISGPIPILDVAWVISAYLLGYPTRSETPL
jgi:hypothetical protein